MASIIVINLLMCVICIAAVKHMHPLSDEFINLINQKQNLWRAGRNFHKDTPFKYLKRLAGQTVIHEDKKSSPEMIDYQNIPAYFDARSMWTRCPSLKQIMDQGSCSSCWAVAAASAMRDRLCIQKLKFFVYSAEDILSCCNECWAHENTGCEGGSLLKAWEFSKREGVVSGGSYGSEMGCIPYNIPPCNHTGPIDCDNDNFIVTPPCLTSCENKEYSVDYKHDKHRFISSRSFTSIPEIQNHIMSFGPVTTAYNVYSDFFSYTCGIYQYTAGSFWGNHSVKVIGWGEDAGTKYWIAANSWNYNWGDKGFFKIIRGNNHLDFERVMYAGNPSARRFR